jgi:hypothetical protein
MDEDRDRGIPDAVRAAWQGAVDAWDDPARHEAVIAQVAQYSCFAWAAARYKERGDDAIAASQLERLRRAAEATMLATATVRRDSKPSPYRATIALFIVLVLAAIGALVVTMVLHDRATEKSSGMPTRTLR